MSQNQVRVGIVGTSWWADAMYLPALEKHPNAVVTACCSRNRERATHFAEKWHIPNVYVDYQTMFASKTIDAVIVATPNDTHYPITMAALDAGLHILCEKPLALRAADAQTMAQRANELGLVNMVPFTYQHMPTTRYAKELIDEGYIGKPYHLNLRYYAGFGRTASAYNWRFDTSVAGSGALGDIGSHFIHLARWFYGEIVGVYCQLGHMVERAPLNPAGSPYPVGDDTALLILTFASGAQGSLHITTLAYEDSVFGQTHHMELHGSGGTLYNLIDWDTRQELRGAREGEGLPALLTVPDRVWGNVRRDKVHDTYKDVFREENFMTREFITAIAAGEQVPLNFDVGARIQTILEAAQLSHDEKRWVATP